MKSLHKALFAFAVAVLTASPAPAASPTVRLATLAPRGTSYHQALLAMREKWRQAPGGGVPLVIYTDGTMGGEADMVSRMRVGQLQAAMLSGVGLAEVDESVRAIQNIPLLYDSLEEMEQVREKLRPTIEKRLLDKGFIVLFWGDAGWVRYFSKDPVLHPADLKKLKLWVWAGDNRHVDVLKSLGYNPVPLETGDMYSGLQPGLVNALTTMPFYALAQQFYSHVPHMLEVNWAPMIGAIVITRKAWEAIPPEARPALMAAAAEAGALIKERGRLENQQAVETMKKRGLVVHPATPEIAAEWRAFAEQVLYPRVVRGHSVPADLFDEVRRRVAEVRSGGGSR